MDDQLEQGQKLKAKLVEAGVREGCNARGGGGPEHMKKLQLSVSEKVQTRKGRTVSHLNAIKMAWKKMYCAPSTDCRRFLLSLWKMMRR